MKQFGTISHSVVNLIECDRCKLEAAPGEILFDAMISIDYSAGYTSPFGDGNRVRLDICEDCFRDLLSSWIQIAEKST